jgi:hypothetical protein
MDTPEKRPNSMRSWIELLVDLGDAALSGLPDRGHHIRDRAGAFVRLGEGVDLRQGHTVNHHGVRHAFLGAPHTASVTRLTG